MNRNQRPISVIVLAGVYIAVGTIGFAHHFSELWSGGSFQADVLLVEVMETLAFLCGVCMLRGQDWARWGALAWMAFHVVRGALHSVNEFAIHCLLFIVIAWFLLRPEASRYFRGAPGEPA